MAKQIPERSQLAPETTWQITDLYPTDEAWQAARKDFLALLERMAGYAGHLGDSAASLLGFLQLQDQKIGRAHV